MSQTNVIRILEIVFSILIVSMFVAIFLVFNKPY